MKKNESIGYYLFENLLLVISRNYRINSEPVFKAFQKGAGHYRKFVFLQDTVIDNDVNWISQYDHKENILYDSSTEYRKAIISLISVFPADHHFWEYLSSEEKIYYDFIIKEKYGNEKKPIVSIEDFEEMTYSKHNLALVPVKGMEWLFEAKVSYEHIKSIFVKIFNGMQMMDDIDDFSKDLQSGQWNLLQYEVQKTIQQESLINDGSLTKFEERVFYASGLSADYSQYALDQYQQAFDQSVQFGFQELSAWLTQVIEEVKASIELVKRISS